MAQTPSHMQTQEKLVQQYQDDKSVTTEFIRGHQQHRDRQYSEHEQQSEVTYQVKDGISHGIVEADHT